MSKRKEAKKWVLINCPQMTKSQQEERIEWIVLFNNQGFSFWDDMPNFLKIVQLVRDNGLESYKQELIKRLEKDINSAKAKRTIRPKNKNDWEHHIMDLGNLEGKRQVSQLIKETT